MHGVSPSPGDRHRGAAGPAVPGKAKLSGKGERSAKGGYSAKAEYPAKGEQPCEDGHSAKAELPGKGARRRGRPPRYVLYLVFLTLLLFWIFA